MSLKFSLLVCLIAAACASKDQLKPSQWLSASELEKLPSLNDVSFESLENMPLQKGAQLLERICKYLYENSHASRTNVSSLSS